MKNWKDKFYKELLDRMNGSLNIHVNMILSDKIYNKLDVLLWDTLYERLDEELLVRFLRNQIL